MGEDKNIMDKLDLMKIEELILYGKLKLIQDSLKNIRELYDVTENKQSAIEKLTLLMDMANSLYGVTIIHNSKITNIKNNIKHTIEFIIKKDSNNKGITNEVENKIKAANINKYEELSSYINYVYSKYMNDEISFAEYKFTTKVIDDIVQKAFK